MTENELLGRLEALAKYVLQLTAELEMAGIIDGPRFSGRLRGPERIADQFEYVQVARERLAGMLNMLDAARAVRCQHVPKQPC